MPRTPPAASARRPRSRATPRWLATTSDLDQIARNRVLLILAVLSGEKPVTTAITEHGISRGFYYQLETKALNAMLLALAPGSDGDASPDAMGLQNRIKHLEAKLTRAETAQRRAERLLHVQRKLTMAGPVKTRRGRPPKQPTSSTPAGRTNWRSPMTKPTTARRAPSSPKLAASTSTETLAGASAAPSAGSENSPAPPRQATT